MDKEDRDNKSPLETAIENDRMEIWNIMREGLELSKTDKMQQLCRMIVAGKMDQDDPWREFKELLATLPVELVFIVFASYFGMEHRYYIFSGSSPIKELYQVNTTCVEAKGSNEEKRTLLQVRERIQINFQRRTKI